MRAWLTISGMGWVLVTDVSSIAAELSHGVQGSGGLWCYSTLPDG